MFNSWSSSYLNSAESDEFHPMKATDGDENTIFSLEGGNTSGGWKVDFHENGVVVDRVEVTMRNDCCWEEA